MQSGIVFLFLFSAIKWVILGAYTLPCDQEILKEDTVSALFQDRIITLPVVTGAPNQMPLSNLTLPGFILHSAIQGKLSNVYLSLSLNLRCSQPSTGKNLGYVA